VNLVAAANQRDDPRNIAAFDVAAHRCVQIREAGIVQHIFQWLHVGKRVQQCPHRATGGVPSHVLE
jgi:hypothetical protein